MSKTALLLRQLDLDAAQLASRSGISENRIREILDGSSLSMGELRALSKALRLPMSAFASGVRPMDRAEELQVLFRRVGNLSSELDPTRDYVANYVSAAVEILPPRSEVPQNLLGFTGFEETFEAAEAIAEEFRKRLVPDLALHPLLNLAELLDKRAGIVVAKLAGSRFEGASLIAGGYPFIFVSPRFRPRTLFTLAHELGHVLVHHVAGEPAMFERASEIGGRRQRVREAFVDAFASALLMPSQAVGRLLQALRDNSGMDDGPIGDIEILKAARFFGVSFEVAARRIEMLQLIPQGGASALVDLIKRRHKSAEKRAIEIGLQPRPQIDIPEISCTLVEAIDAKIDDGEISIGWATDRFGVSISEIYRSRMEVR